jgi:lipoprotein-anchoring transpeptidase ErfK/SrfK
MGIYWRFQLLFLLMLGGLPVGKALALPPDESLADTRVIPARTVTHRAPLFEGGVCSERHVVRRGDTLGEIAQMCRTTIADLLDLNPEITNPNIIHVGHELVLPHYDGPPLYTTRVTVDPAAALPSGAGESDKWIDIDLTNQMLVAYDGHQPVFQSLISSGRQPYLTVIGQFRIERRYVSKDMDGRPMGYDYFLPGVPYAMYFYRAYALHGTYWHANFGAPMSHGCVNLPTPAAEWIFNWSAVGTLVNVRY